jgi:hypothetical protein
MASESRVPEWMSSFSDKISEQVWFQQLKQKWEELDPQSRRYLVFAGIGGFLLAIIFVIFSSIWSVYSLKKELSEKRALLNMIQTANDEIRRLKESVPNAGNQVAEGGPWAPYFESLAVNANVDKASLTVSAEKAGNSSEQTKEALIDLSLKHVNIKQLTRYALAVENGPRPVKLRNLVIDTKEDPTGYLDATLAVSAFNVVVNK